jgi:hypothetical protein
MMLRWLNDIRCRIGARFARSKWPKGIGLACRIAPDTTSLIRHRPRRAPALPLPRRSHLIYHQTTVDRGAAENSLATLAPQIPLEDEVLVLDVGAAADASLLERFRRHEWSTYSACQANQPTQRSYTFGLNTGLAMLKGAELFVWRTDYVYPPDLMARYLRSLEQAWFAVPYDVLVGHREIDSRFVAGERHRLDPFDESFWAARSTRLSLYETQDPALFAIRRELWESIGGLNHELWGYGWQFAEFAARVRAACPESRIDYFAGAPPVHQTHEGSQMHQPVERKDEAEAGRQRFVRFLGSEAAYEIYRLRQNLPSRRQP